LGESQVVTLVDIHGSHNGQTLDVVGVCVNRIGTRYSSRNGNDYSNLLFNQGINFYHHCQCLTHVL
jgi:hypothetical protein